MKKPRQSIWSLVDVRTPQPYLSSIMTLRYTVHVVYG